MKTNMHKFLVGITLVCGLFLAGSHSPVRAATFQMQTGYYMGDGADNRAITGVGFQPELVIIKDDTSNGSLGALWKSSVMSGETTAHFADAAVDITSDAIQSLDSNGFTLGTNADVNGANVRFTWIAFRGSDCSSSGTFCVGSYLGDGNSPRTVSTVGFQPNMVTVKGSTAVAGVFRTASMGTNIAQLFSAANEVTDGSVFQTLDSTGFTVGSGTRVNSASTNYWFFAFKTTTGAFAEGTYTGDGTDNRAFTTPGFKPNYMWLKNANATTPVRAEFSLTESNGDYSGAFSDLTNATNQIQSLDTTGFTVGSDAASNENTKTFYWMTFAGASSPTASGTYQMKVGTYTGNGTTQSLSSFGFAPDLVIIKDQANATHAVFRTRMMKGDLTSYFANTAVHFAGGITSLDSDGFSVGADASVNTNAATYQYQAFGNAFSPEDNTGAADFMIGAYTGAAVDDRNIVRMPFQPNLVAIKPNSTASGMWRTSAQTGDASVGFSGVAESIDNIQSLNSDGFQVGTSTRVNGGTTTAFYFFAFKTSSTMFVGSYTGTGSAQDITSIGFSPNMLWVKSTGTANAVFRPSPLVGNSTLVFPAVAAVSDRITALLSTGFSVGGNQTETNTGTTVYRYAAWKTNDAPATPSLDSPSDAATGISITPTLLTTATDAQSDYLRYKIELCTNSGMTTGCQTFDQTSSQTGWSGQNAQTNTAYTSGTQASYTLQSALSYATTYYWRSYAIDPGGSNTFGSTQTPRSFTTINVPAAPSGLSGTALSSTSIQWSWTDNADNENGFYVQDTGLTTQCTVASASSGTGSTVTCTETGLNPSTSYTRQVVAYNAAGNSAPSATATVATSAPAGTFTVNLVDPGDKSYTSDDRPVFRWKAITDASEGISRYDFYDHNGDLALTGIPASRTEDYVTSKYIVKYENFSDSDSTNNYLALQTKSSPEWNNESAAGNIDGKLKEGIHTWSVTGVTNSGVERSASRTVFVDKHGPTVSANILENGNKPSIVGRMTDELSGGAKNTSVASGPSSIEIRIEKRNTLGTYDLYSLNTLQIDKTYWEKDDTEITDNAWQQSDKYANFSYTSPQSLPLGTYKIGVTARDRVGNASSVVELAFRLAAREVAPIADTYREPESSPQVPAPSSSPTPTMSPSTVEIVTTSLPVPKDNFFTKAIDIVESLYWKIVDSVRYVASLIGNGSRAIASWIGGINPRISEMIAGWVRPVGRITGTIEKNIAMTIDVWFSRDPVKISNVQIVNVQTDSAVIKWTTSHYTNNNKVNYGETLSYGKEGFAPDREKEHQIVLTGLKPNTKYVFEVMSQGKNYVYDSHYEFTTLSQ